jgi:Xaa-Pro aminopeptidase
MDRSEEMANKVDRVRAIARDHDLGGVLIRDRGNFAWLTAGGLSYVNAASEVGVGALLVTPETVHLLANNIESGRLVEEELVGLEVELAEYPWHEPDGERVTIEQLMGTAAVGMDSPGGGPPVADAIVQARGPMVGPEIDRYRALGALASRTTEDACRRIERGMTEDDVRAMIERAFAKQGVRVPVCLIAADQRLTLRRHPIPKGEPIDRRVMVVVCAEAKGLIVALTRIVGFEAPDEALAAKHGAVCRIETATCAACRPGRTLGEVFNEIVATYEMTGYGEEWRLHHQGGTIGYAGRDAFAHPASRVALQADQGIAWNPSITGTKSEDTFLLRGTGNVEPITAPGTDWPGIEVEHGELQLRRPDILTLG